MTKRERFLNALNYRPVDRVPDFEFGSWEQTLVRWHSEGLPLEYNDAWGVMPGYFGTEDGDFLNIPMHIGLLPGFEYEVLEERGDHIIARDGDGAICEMMRPELGASIPKYLRYCIEDRRDWERLRDERLRLDDPARNCADLDEVCRKSVASELPVKVWLGSLYGWIRNWMGVENLSYAVYDQPLWVEEMMEHLCSLTLFQLEKIAGKARVDIGSWWEDMCFRSGPLLSPAHFSKWMGPRYRRVTGFLRRECGCGLNMLDCDGDIHSLVPLWLEGGINVMYPLEAAHTDACRIADEHGKRVSFMGYIDKRALAEGPDAIDRELARVAPLVKRGGFIPHLDHLVPPDVSLENYRYYREKKRRLLGMAP